MDTSALEEGRLETEETLDFDAERLFTAEVAETVGLSREEEDRLARQIAVARNRVRRVLRGARRLTNLALADMGRGVVSPEADFREREAIVILNYAQALLRRSRSPQTIAGPRKRVRAFVEELSRALAEYRVLRDRMLEANLRLVLYFARRHRHPSLSFLDFVQEGTLGLIRAVEKYEPGRNIKFGTYAVYWIWQQISRAADTQGALIRTPVHWSQLRRRMARELHRQVGDSDQPRSAEEWASEQGLDLARVHTMAQAYHTVSVDAPIGEDDDRPLGETLAASEVEPEQSLLQTDLRARLDSIIEQLPNREAEIMRRRFGLDNDETETLEEVGERFGVSRERIRQLENRALRRLRELCEAEGLDAYLQ